MASTREDEGVEDLVRILDEVGLVATGTRPLSGDRDFDAVLRVGTRRLPVEVRRDVRESDASTLVEKMPAHALVVADRLSPKARSLLEEHEINWLDRRGHLRLVLPPGIFIDRDIEPLVVDQGRQRANLFTKAGLDVAIALLLAPTEPPGVRGISRRTGTSAGRVSQLMSELRARGLVNRNGTPAIPDLFEATADAWCPQWVSLGGTPPTDPNVRLGGSRAAIWRGVALAVTEGWPPELYVRDECALRRLVRTYPPDRGQAISPVAQAAVCPSTYGFDEEPGGPGPEYPVVNHIVVALDLAQDHGRGREALEQWNPDGGVRVW